ncbi:TIGR02757 family protein [Algoriphagus jejuensis]|uniref:TIGR02757 family protein n=1 Tax=Algoriphagus jejuensis TaxID=419934 RepID=A0ABP3YET1_9BACT
MHNLKEFLDDKVSHYNRPEFIANDPICIPHRFNKKQDIEIAGFFASILAWGQRKTIINKCVQLFELMDNAPHDFLLNHRESDLNAFLSFKHRTFNDVDTLYFIHFLSWFYREHESFEEAFLIGQTGEIDAMGSILSQFHGFFFSLPDFPNRTKKHIATPARKAACKRINMYLRWMVRSDDSGVDFGLWKKISPAQLICPCDLHVDRVGRKLGLITRKQTDWLTAVELTQRLREFDPVDPVKYDFALFGLGIEERF